MSIFDELGKKITETGRNAVQKTKEMTDVSKMNSYISQEEKRINSLYYEIGKLYYTIHASDYEENFADVVNEIKEAENKIESFRREIQTIKAVKRCTSCGAEIPENARFCLSCGAKVQEEQKSLEENTNICKSCGAVVEEGAKFCTSCGTLMEIELVEDGGEPDDMPFVEGEAEVNPEFTKNVEENRVLSMQKPEENNETNETEMCTIEDIVGQQEIKCKNCGARIEPGTVFCTECGTKLNVQME